jgi:fatty-acyl-CoA synthase
VGKPLAIAQVRIVDDEGAEVAQGEFGEIVCKSPMSAKGYGDSRRDSQAPFPEGWVATGDLGRLDEDGYLYIEGRKKDVIITGGHKVGAFEVENVLNAVPGVLECAVIGAPDPIWGERVVAIVVVKTLAQAPSKEQLEARCRALLSSYKVPKQYIFQEQPLPRTATAKVQKFRLVGQWDAGGSAVSGSEHVAQG